jgi:hypothetical protein
MWDDIDFTQDTTQDLKWVAEGMQNNTLVCVDIGLVENPFHHTCL